MIPDLALQTAIAEGLRALKRDFGRIDDLFGNLPLAIRQQVADFLVRTPIHLSHGFPFETPKLPHVILLLRREEDAGPLLGQAIDGGPEAEEELLLRADDVGPLRPLSRPDPGVGDALLAERARSFPEETVPLSFTERDLVDATGRIERLHYDAEVRTQDYFATAFLHRALKAILLGAAPQLEAWGIHDLVLGGLDLEHTGQEYPHAVFARALTLTFQYVFALHDRRPPLRAIEGGIAAAEPGAVTPGAQLGWQITIA